MIYLASPYSHCPLGHEIAFTSACVKVAELYQLGKDVFSPIVHSHPIAKYGGLNPVDHEFWMRRDRWFMDKCDRLLVMTLAGWKESRGVQEEIEYFEAQNKPVDHCDPPIPENVLQEAMRITSGDRDGDYGHPAEHWSRTVGAINANYGTHFKPRDWGMFMIFDKIAREQNRPKRDNLVDIVGYARCIEKVDERTRGH